MADRFLLDLKTLEISSWSFESSLSVASVAFVYDVPPPLQHTTQDFLRSLIRSKQLWLLPRGLCRLDIHVKLSKRDIWQGERDGFLGLVADAVCQASLWSQLGLSVKILDVQYHQEESNIPNLYFSIEQTDMSSALLSPPHAHTAHMKGIECILRFESSSKPNPSRKRKGLGESQVALPLGRVTPSKGDPASVYTYHSPDLTDLYENTACLVEAALSLTFGTRKRWRGLKILEPDKAPSLLDLAPGIWNSHYLRFTLNHTKHFAVISNIFASSLNGQSPELRRKAAKLVQGDVTQLSNVSDQTPRPPSTQLISSIQCILWGLVQDTLKPTIGTCSASRNFAPPKAGFNHQDHKIDKDIVGSEGVDQSSFLDSNYYPYGNLSLPSGLGYNHYEISTSYNTDMDLAWPQSSNFTPLPHGDYAPGISEAQGEVGLSSREVDVPGGQFLRPHSRDFSSGLCHTTPGHIRTDYAYEDDNDIYGYAYNRYEYMGQGPVEHGLATATTFPLDGLGEDISDGEVMRESIHGLET
ncbi:hypothetical protein NUW58_g5540 [Xylaria curta]|uniref:Uncharacterized protein n=1 Tax=Xylaria curta TaxID=42375 RepID=A0ACC1P1V7_9PEZI|nr:hypothetical protein NUW58_g5540 [Xylaria curta]